MICRAAACQRVSRASFTTKAGCNLCGIMQQVSLNDCQSLHHISQNASELRCVTHLIRARLKKWKEGHRDEKPAEGKKGSTNKDPEPQNRRLQGHESSRGTDVQIVFYSHKLRHDSFYRTTPLSVL